MTLVVRLFFVGLLGIALFFGYTWWLEPVLREQAAAQAAAPAGADGPRELSKLFGQYVASTADGHYVLTLDGKGAELRFTDKKKQEYSYRGHYTVDGSAMEVEWNARKQGGNWSPMQAVLAKMQLQLPDVIRSAEITFTRAAK